MNRKESERIKKLTVKLSMANERRSYEATVFRFIKKLTELMPSISPEQAMDLWNKGFRSNQGQVFVRNCASCQKELVLPDGDDNVLRVNFTGGYGQFIDPMDYEQDAYLCHDCAHKFCEDVPWVNFTVNPYAGHSHRDPKPEGHWGWDYDIKR